MTADAVPTPREIIEGAITQLETQGHTVHMSMDPDTGSLCLLGALDLAAAEGVVVQTAPGRFTYTRPAYENIEPGHPRFYALQEAIAAVASQLPPERGRGYPNPVAFQLAWWNDHHCDGGEDAILLLKRAAETLP